MDIYSIFNFLILFLSGMRNDVFLSFNYKETGKNFSDHLHSAISGEGFRTFVAASNNANLHLETIKKELEKSRASVVVFSKDFAWSSRCLDEVVMMMETRNKSGLIVLPIFYHARPSELRWLNGRYGEAFAEHEMRFPEERVVRWKAALSEISYLQAMVLRRNMAKSGTITIFVPGNTGGLTALWYPQWARLRHPIVTSRVEKQDFASFLVSPSGADHVSSIP